MSTSELSGSWTYRSFNPRFVTGNETPQEAALIMADRVVLTLNPPVPRNVVDGTIEWEGGGLVLKGLFARQQAIIEDLLRFDIVGTGRPGTDTAGWEYHYLGYLTRQWPGLERVRVDQIPTLVGSVIRVKPHNGRAGGWRSEAGEVFSFIAVKQPPLTWESSGSWTYRSFRNNATYPYLTAPPTAHGLILQEALFKLETPTDTTLQGTIELPGGVLDLSLGEVRPAEVRRVGPEFAFVGTGRPGTKTDGWEYSYHGNLTRQWQEGVGQRPALVGSVIRVKPHGEAAPAGSVYPFIAVKQ